MRGVGGGGVFSYKMRGVKGILNKIGSVGVIMNKMRSVGGIFL